MCRHFEGDRSLSPISPALHEWPAAFPGPVQQPSKFERVSVVTAERFWTRTARPPSTHFFRLGLTVGVLTTAEVPVLYFV
jgi:hypothetical protein